MTLRLCPRPGSRGRGGGRGPCVMAPKENWASSTHWMGAQSGFQRRRIRASTTSTQLHKPVVGWENRLCQCSAWCPRGRRGGPTWKAVLSNWGLQLQSWSQTFPHSTPRGGLPWGGETALWWCPGDRVLGFAQWSLIKIMERQAI